MHYSREYEGATKKTNDEIGYRGMDIIAKGAFERAKNLYTEYVSDGYENDEIMSVGYGPCADLLVRLRSLEVTDFFPFQGILEEMFLWKLFENYPFILMILVKIFTLALIEASLQHSV